MIDIEAGQGRDRGRYSQQRQDTVEMRRDDKEIWPHSTS